MIFTARHAKLAIFAEPPHEARKMLYFQEGRRQVAGHYFSFTHAMQNNTTCLEAIFDAISTDADDDDTRCAFAIITMICHIATTSRDDAQLTAGRCCCWLTSRTPRHIYFRARVS